MKIINCKQGSAKWFSARCGIPTGSKLANIVTSKGDASKSTSRATYKAELIHERLTGSAINTFTNEAMERGNKLEPIARDYFTMMTGKEVDQVGFCKHNIIDCGISPDGLIGDNEGLEIKTAKEANHIKKLLANKVPADNMVQIQACMWITYREKWHYLLYTDIEGVPNMMIEVPRNDKVISALELYVPVFIAELDAEEATLRKRYGLPPRKVVDLDKESGDWRPF